MSEHITEQQINTNICIIQTFYNIQITCDLEQGQHKAYSEGIELHKHVHEAQTRHHHYTQYDVIDHERVILEQNMIKVEDWIVEFNEIITI